VRAVGKIIWFIESSFRKDITLDDIASACGISRFHMCRVFASATGYSVIQYLRGRRLTEAARQLAAGAPSILDVALDAGYSSHEAFTRAFRDCFGLTPEAVREGSQMDQTRLVEPIRMNIAADKTIDLPEPRKEVRGAMTIVGLARRYPYTQNQGIPAQWTEFQAYEGTVGEKPGFWFGVCDAFDEAAGTFRYTCGVEVDNPGDIPGELEVLKIEPATYLVFVHAGHISGIKDTMDAIWRQYMPECPFEADGDAPMFELYDEKFDGRTGLGGIEVWIPVRG
jgi:AraC family transcriptional regulator